MQVILLAFHILASSVGSKWDPTSVDGCHWHCLWTLWLFLGGMAGRSIQATTVLHRSLTQNEGMSERCKLSEPLLLEALGVGSRVSFIFLKSCHCHLHQLEQI